MFERGSSTAEGKGTLSDFIIRSYVTHGMKYIVNSSSKIRSGVIQLKAYGKNIKKYNCSNKSEQFNVSQLILLTLIINFC